MPTTLVLPRQIRILALALCVAGCRASDATGIIVEPNEFVRVTATSDGLTVVNQTGAPIFLFAVNAETLALLDWAPCTGGPSCPPLARGAQRMIPWSSVYSYSPSARQFTVFWWHGFALADGAVRADPVQSVTVTR
jgi:hypothetical protein